MSNFERKVVKGLTSCGELCGPAAVGGNFALRQQPVVSSSDGGEPCLLRGARVWLICATSIQCVDETEIPYQCEKQKRTRKKKQRPAVRHTPFEFFLVVTSTKTYCDSFGLSK